MLQLNNYVKALFNVKWEFDEAQKDDLEGLLFVEFKRHSNGKSYVISDVKYTYADILLGMSELEFTFTKRGSDYKLQIL